MTSSSRRRRSNRRPATARRVVSPQVPVDPIDLDHSREYLYIRRDLIRILLWGGGMIALMIALYVAGIF